MIVPLFLPSGEPTELFFWVTLSAILLLFLGCAGMFGWLSPRDWRKRRIEWLAYKNEVPDPRSWVSCNLPTVCLGSFFLGVTSLNVGTLLRFHPSVAFLGPLFMLAALVLILGPIVLMVRR